MKYGSAVKVVHSQEELAPQAVIPPGSRMTFDGYLCSAGYGARDSSGKQYLVTAGHCVEKLPVLSYNNVPFARGTHSRYVSGGRSVDMGVAAIDAGNSIATSVYTWGQRQPGCRPWQPPGRPGRLPVQVRPDHGLGLRVCELVQRQRDVRRPERRPQHPRHGPGQFHGLH